MLGDVPLPASASVKMWAQGEGGRVAESLVRGLLLPQDVHFWSEGSEDSIVWKLQWHSIANTQLTHILSERASKLTEDVERKKALKEVAIDMAWDKVNEAKVAEQKAQSSEAARQLAEEKSQAEAADDKDTPSMRALVEAIDTHVENANMEATSNLNAPGHAKNQRPTTEDAIG
nr:hypothetical protein CFP56_31356 [Quercus suber]